MTVEFIGVTRDVSVKTHPPHYQGAKGLECIDVIEAFDLGFCTGNALKYLLRAGKKQGESELEDLRKAEWYIQRRLRELGGIEQPDEEESS